MQKLFLFLLLTISLQLSAQKKSLDHSVYDSWQSIGEKLISNNGSIVIHTINPQEGDATLVIQNNNGTKIMEVQRGYAAKITNDGKFVVFKIKPTYQQTRDAKIKKKKADEMPKDSLGIVNIATGTLEKFARVKSFKIADKSSEWLSWQYEKEEKKKAENNDKKEDEGTLLVVRNLWNNKQDSLALTTEYFFDKNGKHLLVESAANIKDSIKASVNLIDLLYWKKQRIFYGFNDAKGYSFDEEGTQISFIAERDSIKKESQKFYQLFYFKNNFDSAVMIVNKTSQGMPVKWSVSEFGNISFSKSGKRLFFGTAPILPLKDTSLPEFERVNVDVWHYNDDDLQPAQLKNLENDLKKNYLARYDFETKKVVQLGNENFERVEKTSEGDGVTFYSTTDAGKRVAKQWQGFTLRDVYAVNPIDGKVTLIRINLKGNISSSYSGNYLLMYDEQLKQYQSYNALTQKINKIAADIQYPLYDEENDVPDDPNAYGIAKWMEGDKHVLIYDKFDIWKVDPLGKEKSIALTSGRKNSIQSRLVNFDEDKKFVNTDDTILLKTYNEKTKGAGIAKLYFSNNGKLNLVQTTIPISDCFINNIVQSKNATNFIFTKERYESSPNLYAATVSGINKITNLNPQQANYNWGSAELFQWKAYTGKLTEGVLYKPENFDVKKKYPMIVYFYERNNQTLYNYIAPTPTPSRLNISFFVSRGYIVFVPDIWYKNGKPGQSAYDYIVSGTRAVVKLGFVDSTKLGLQGQSWGGYQIAHLITRTKLYAAAWAGAPVVNMTSAYGGIRWGTGINRQFQYEKTQSRIGANLWERRDLYIENSPLFHLQNVTTPVVIMANDKDDAVPWYQGIEMFSALRRLNKKVWMLNYNDEVHNLMERRNRKDIQIREQQFFDWLLKGEKPATWLSEGLPAVMKGRTLGL
jgi:dipeptidyl aminopeptidase/acylaminoacyl peptidase